MRLCRKPSGKTATKSWIIQMSARRWNFKIHFRCFPLRYKTMDPEKQNGLHDLVFDFCISLSHHPVRCTVSLTSNSFLLFFCYWHFLFSLWNFWLFHSLTRDSCISFEVCVFFSFFNFPFICVFMLFSWSFIVGAVLFIFNAK